MPHINTNEFRERASERVRAANGTTRSLRLAPDEGYDYMNARQLRAGKVAITPGANGIIANYRTLIN